MRKKKSVLPPFQRQGSAFPLSQLIMTVTQPLMKGPKKVWAQLALYWPNVVGKDIAAISYPVRCRLPTEKSPRGTLTLGVWDGFGLQLSYQQSLIIERINRYFGYGAIHKITFRPVEKPSQNDDRPISKKCLSNTQESSYDQLGSLSLDSVLSSFAKAIATDVAKDKEIV